METINLGLSGSSSYDSLVDDHPAVFRGFGDNALVAEIRTEKRNEGWGDMMTEGGADSKSTFVRHPVP